MFLNWEIKGPELDSNRSKTLKRKPFTATSEVVEVPGKLLRESEEVTLSLYFTNYYFT